MSDRLWIRPIRNKKAPTIKKALSSIFETINGPITEIASDEGELQFHYHSVTHYFAHAYQ
jgi:hypothetical protein